MIAPLLLLAASQAMTFSADRIAADSVTRALVATGHLEAVSGPLKIKGELLTRDADGRMVFHDPVYATTCTNAPGHTHWNICGEIEYCENESVTLRNAWLEFYEIPILWIPYLYYPLDWDCGFSWMPGYTGRWGAYLLTKYRYNLLGDESHRDDTWWLKGDTRFDLRYRQGIALGEDLDWNLGDFGAGRFGVYYAWDEDEDRYSNRGKHHMNRSHWGSSVDRDRYSVWLQHRWEATERDVIRIGGSTYSDSYFRSDFVRKSMFNWKSQFLGYEGNGIFWEHLENNLSFGAEASGRLNKFYGMIDRLPEVYFDVNPLPVFGLPVNYESENHFGYLHRNYAEYGDNGQTSVYSANPGPWAQYETFRGDTYHRLTAPFRTLDDLMAVVPRVGYHGTFWNKSGKDDLEGKSPAENCASVTRSIAEGGLMFSGRGTAWVNERWQHVMEPYLDLLAQKAWYDGLGDGNRPYVFDSRDASLDWEDQFAGRSRNLPYSYYGLTPGFRNSWDKADEFGKLRRVMDFDVYAAFQLNDTTYLGTDDAHRLAEVGKPNYGEDGMMVVPGARLRWTPTDDVRLAARAEYDSENDRLAFASLNFNRKVTETFSYYVDYSLCNYRLWDFSSRPYASQEMTSDEFNRAKFHNIQVGFECQPLDWFACGPYLRWDLDEQELDCVGAWFDYLTDCLGFRFLVDYETSYTMIDGHEREDDWSFGFYVYLRAFGAAGPNIFGP